MKASRSSASRSSSPTLSVMSVAPPDSTPASSPATTASCAVAVPLRRRPSHRHLERGAAAGAGQRDRHLVGRRVALHHGQRLGLGVGEQAIAVHRDAVAFAQQKKLLRLGRRLCDLGHADGLEGLRRAAASARPADPCAASSGRAARSCRSRPGSARRPPRPGPYRSRRAPGPHRRSGRSRSRRRAPCRMARRPPESRCA